MTDTHCIEHACAWVASGGMITVPDQTNGVLSMAYTYDVVGWEDSQGDRHEGRPTDISDTYSVFVFAYDDANPADYKYFWAHIPPDESGERPIFDDWDTWDAYVGSMMDISGPARGVT